MSETPVIKSIEPFIMFDLPETPIEPKRLTFLKLLICKFFKRGQAWSNVVKRGQTWSNLKISRGQTDT